VAEAASFRDTPSLLRGRHAVVTGGGSGIGAAIAKLLACSGADITLMGRDHDRLQTQADAIMDAASAVQTVVRVGCMIVDVTDAESVARGFAAMAEQLGPIEILVNNAGAAESAAFLKTDRALLERMLAVNLTGAFLCTQAVLPAMLRAKSGRLVNIASTAGVTGYPYVAAYCAAKHALVGLTRALARELATSGVTVNAVCPGFTDTDLVARSVETIVAKTGRSADEARAELAKTNPMGRLIQPEEVASAVLYLCRDDAAAVTGQAIVVAGGEVMA
jgi:NAD(P)-dependent dehydrogenase (short-subunit alcohol dehydrogenase family)